MPPLKLLISIVVVMAAGTACRVIPIPEQLPQVDDPNLNAQRKLVSGQKYPDGYWARHKLFHQAEKQGGKEAELEAEADYHRGQAIYYRDKDQYLVNKGGNIFQRFVAAAQSSRHSLAGAKALDKLGKADDGIGEIYQYGVRTRLQAIQDRAWGYHTQPGGG